MNTLVYRIVLMFIILSAVTVPSFAQPPDTLGIYHWDYSEIVERAYCVKALPSGGYIASGWSHFNNVTQVWTARLDQDMNEIWVDFWGGASTDAAYHTEPTSDGGFIQCGESWSYGPGEDDAFIRKITADGETEWVQYEGTPNWSEYFWCVREVPAGGYVAIGYSDNHHLYRYDESGEFIWRWEDPGAAFIPTWVEPLADGGFIVASQRHNDEVGDRVATIYKVSADGQTLWMNEEAVPGLPIEGFTLCAREDPNGFLYVCGFTTVIVDDTVWTEFYVSKRNPDGSIIWSLNYDNPDFEGQDSDALAELCLLADGNIAVGGYSHVDAWYNYFYLAKISTDGEILWQTSVAEGIITSLDQGRDGSIVAAHYIQPYNDDPHEILLARWEPEVEIGLQTWTPVIPETGGWLRYGAQVSNILIDPTPLDAWIVVTGPSGNRELVNHFPITLQPGSIWTRPQINVHIPGGYPNGTYTYEINIGDADTRRNMGLGSFTFTKGE
jgi:hypothetical protein